MLASLAGAVFAPFVERVVHVRDDSGAAAELTVMAVREYPHHMPAWAGSDRRVPFNVLLRGPLHPELGRGLHVVTLDADTLIEGVAIQRILPQDGRPDHAWYQIAFN